MSLACFVVLDRDIPGCDPFVNGKTLGHHVDALSAECDELAVRPLGDMVGVERDQLAAFLAEQGLDDLPIPDETWFSASEGIQTVEALLGILPDRHHLAEVAEALAQDLSEILVVLKQAEEAGARFHLQYDF